MNKQAIVQRIVEKTGVTQLMAKEIVQETFDAIIDILATHRRIELRKFGVFKVKHRAGRTARNPHTKASVEVEPKDVVVFKPGKEMKEKIGTKTTPKKRRKK